MKKKLPDLKIRVDDEMRAAIEDEVTKRKKSNPEGASVSSVVRDAIRALLFEVPQVVPQNNLNSPRLVSNATPSEGKLPRKKNGTNGLSG